MSAPIPAPIVERIPRPVTIAIQAPAHVDHAYYVRIVEHNRRPGGPWEYRDHGVVAGAYLWSVMG